MMDFTGLFTSSQQEFVDGLRENGFNVVKGNTDYSRLSFPTAQYFMDRSNYTGNGNYEEEHTILYLFEKSTQQDKMVENAEKIEESLNDIHSNLKDGSGYEFKPVNFEFMVAEYEDTLMDVVSVTVRVSKVVDFAEQY